MKARCPLLVALVLLAPGARAQQFRRQPEPFPGPTRWTEGVALADVDEDGDLDPTLTIMALAWRGSDYLAEQLGRQSL